MLYYPAEGHINNYNETENNFSEVIETLPGRTCSCSICAVHCLCEIIAWPE